MRLTLTLPKDKTGRREPLLVTGTIGRGDLVYIVYESDRSVRFGMDHWGKTGLEYPSFPVDYDAPQTVEISLGSIHPDRPAAPSRQPRHTAGSERWTVRLNGQTAMEMKSPAYPASREQIHVGSNPIGGSTCDPMLTATVHQEAWLGY